MSKQKLPLRYEELRARINALVDALDTRTHHDVRMQHRSQPPASWNDAGKYAWTCGYTEGQTDIANTVRTILATFVKENGLD